MTIGSVKPAHRSINLSINRSMCPPTPVVCLVPIRRGSGGSTKRKKKIRKSIESSLSVLSLSLHLSPSLSIRARIPENFVERGKPGLVGERRSPLLETPVPALLNASGRGWPKFNRKQAVVKQAKAATATATADKVSAWDDSRIAKKES